MMNQKKVYVEGSDSGLKSSIHSEKNKLNPIKIIKNAPCKHDGTIQEYFFQKIKSPIVEDFGWTLRRGKNRYIVERIIKIQNLRNPTIYRWFVNLGGSVSPVNGHAVSISR